MISLMRVLFSSMAVCALLASCESGTDGKKDTADTHAALTRKKGRIWDKVNIVQIPLTAAENNIHGNVSSVRYADYEFVQTNGQYQKVLTDSGCNVYDEHGHLVDQKEYDAKGKPKWKCLYEYDASGHAVKWDFNFSSDGHRSHDVTRFYYDANGWKVASENNSTDAGEPVRSAFKYDEAGNEIEETTYMKDKSVYSVSSYKYNADGDQVEHRMTSYSGGDMSATKRTASYDAYGNKVAGAYYRGDSLMGRSAMENDVKGRCISSVGYTPDGKPSGSMKFTYDDNDNMTGVSYYNADGSIDTTGWNSAYEYQYDAKGNRTKETYYRIRNGSKVPTSYTENVFTYHK